MMEINGKWFYKSPEAKTIDLMAAFFEKPLEGEADLTLRLLLLLQAVRMICLLRTDL